MEHSFGPFDLEKATMWRTYYLAAFWVEVRSSSSYQWKESKEC